MCCVHGSLLMAGFFDRYSGRMLWTTRFIPDRLLTQVSYGLFSSSFPHCDIHLSFQMTSCSCFRRQASSGELITHGGGHRRRLDRPEFILGNFRRNFVKCAASIELHTDFALSCSGRWKALLIKSRCLEWMDNIAPPLLLAT
jgi:hypothetical protein